ncbi:MAG: long-chain fatty acid--CoA ligase [Tannerellaceae bacterium]|jgi:long-chain acyl-CoA synthetase|nr:long-chain fatty acid--CoA ligase [Tannerellaceae bacterium]
MSTIHYAELIHRQADKYNGRAALKYRNEATGKWEKISWREFSNRIMLTAKAMADYGIAEQETIGLYSQNMPQCLIIDFAAYANRAIPVPMYATSSPAQVEYIVRDAEISTLFVGEQLQYNHAFIVQKKSPGLKRLIIFDRTVRLNPEDKTSVYFDDFIHMGDNAHAETTVKVRMKAATTDDVATFIYTSGTTGESKGVVLHHSNFLEAMRIHGIRLPIITDKQTSMCFLPLTHIFEKAWTYLCLCNGVTVAINRDPKMIQQTLTEVHPTMMCNVPRFWEKVYAGVHDKIAGFPYFLRRIAGNAVETGRLHNMKYKNNGLKPPLWLRLKFGIYNKTIFATLKKVLGIERGVLFPVAGAPLSDDVNVFLQSVNIPLAYGYGLSETTATVSFCPREGFTVGSIGVVMPDVEVRIDEKNNNEILVRGKTVFSGYYKRPEANAKAFTDDGFFRTGDAGRLEGDTLFFTERIKDLYKTSNGKYIAPQAIEALMSKDKFIAQIAVIGDQRKFVGALIVPDFDMLRIYASDKKITYTDNENLIKLPAILRLMESRVEEGQKDLASYEKIKRFILLPFPFTMEGRELTDTLKLRRRVIVEKYASLIDAMYKE